MWAYREYDEKEADRLAAGAGISRLLAKVFVSRGVSGAEGIEYVKSFLDMDASRLHDPFLMDGMDKAVERVLRAVGNRERILVYGDYDVDGVTAVSILIDFLASLGADVSYFIPDRMEDGYGITMDSAARVKELEPSVVITVDCGITSVDEVRYLMESGIDVIVTDHHECKQELPQAVAVLNPHKPGCTYPFKDLSGAGGGVQACPGHLYQHCRREGKQRHNRWSGESRHRWRNGQIYEVYRPRSAVNDSRYRSPGRRKQDTGRTGTEGDDKHREHRT